LFLGVTDEDQRQVVGIPSKEEFRCAVDYLPTGRKEAMASQYGLNPIQLASRSDVEGNRPETQRLLAMASLMNTPRFTKDQDDGCGRHTTQHHDCLLASDLIEGTEVSVEGDGSIEVANRDQCGTNGPRLCDVVSGHGVSSVSLRFSSGKNYGFGPQGIGHPPDFWSPPRSNRWSARRVHGQSRRAAGGAHPPVDWPTLLCETDALSMSMGLT
jgi:hypothetical protein